MSRLLTQLSLFAAALLVAGATVTTPSYADGAADINARQALMKSIGGEMKAIGGIIKGTAGDPATLGAHTQELAALSKKVKMAFPEGSGPEAGETEALPNIWTDMGTVEKIIDDLVSATDNLAKVAMTGDLKAAGAAMGVVGKDGCGACHKTFRKKKS